LGLRHRPSCRLPTRGFDFRARPTVHAVRRDSHDHPLFGFRSPTGCDPLALPHVSRHPAPLLGFVPLQRLSVGGVYVASACGPIRRLRSVPRVSHPLDGFLLFPPRSHLSAQAALMGFSLQGFPLSSRPASSSLSGVPSWRCSLGLRSLLLGKERTGGATVGSLGAFHSHLCVAFRALLCSRVRAVREHG